jgi:hypothetical protein
MIDLAIDHYHWTSSFRRLLHAVARTMSAATSAPAASTSGEDNVCRLLRASARTTSAASCAPPPVRRRKDDDRRLLHAVREDDLGRARLSPHLDAVKTRGF